MAARERRGIHVEGIVQGVGFRPFLYGLATRLRLGGRVGNDAHGVFVEVEGGPDHIQAFLRALRHEARPLAIIERIEDKRLEATGDVDFVIVASRSGDERHALVPPDTATCADCLRELFDPGDRRYRYPFINCTNCGPRFTIVKDVPYDRSSTTMAAFAMCDACAGEYRDPADRRYHTPSPSAASPAGLRSACSTRPAFRSTAIRSSARWSGCWPAKWWP